MCVWGESMDRWPPSGRVGESWLLNKKKEGKKREEEKCIPEEEKKIREECGGLQGGVQGAAPEIQGGGCHKNSRGEGFGGG